MKNEARPEAALFITGWWPGTRNPHDGVFVREHALAVATRRPVVVIHLEVEVARWEWPHTVWEESLDEGLVVLQVRVRTPIRRGGWHGRLVHKAYKKAIQHLGGRFRFRTMHIHVRTPTTEIAAQVGHQLGLPSLVTEHSSFYHVWIDHLPPAARAKEVERIKQWFGQPFIRAVLPVSADLGRVLHDRFGVPAERIHVVPNVASPLFVPGRPKPAPPFHVVLAARWSEPKDPLLFIRTLQRLPEEVLGQLRITWVGDGGQLDEVRTACAPWVARGIVEFTGRLPKPQLAALLGEAHVLVHPTKAENLPCIILESLSCGTPVLSHAVNGIPELIDDSNGILCPPGDVEAFALGFMKIRDDHGRFDREAIAAAAHERYSRPTIAAKLVALYDQVARP